MPLVNHIKREIHAKLVLFGPAGSGKKTSLSYIYRKLKPECRGMMRTMSLQNDRMVFFDFLPGSKSGEGYAIQYHLYTITGANVADSSWRMVLKGADGILFVADSDPERKLLNSENSRQLSDMLAASGISLQGMPLVVQGNKRDLADAVPLDDLFSDLTFASVPVTGATAITGAGVLESLFALIKTVQARLAQEGLDLKQDAKQVIEEQPEEHDTPLVLDEPADGPDAISEQPVAMAKPFVELAGDPVPFPGGLRLPVLVGVGNAGRRMNISVTLSFDEEP